MTLALVGAIAALSLLQAKPVRADSACTSLPIDSTYQNGHWFTGGKQLHSGVNLTDTRGSIRTYNPFVAWTNGDVSAWVMLYNDAGSVAQVGWAKGPSAPDIYNAEIFVQYTDASGNFYPPQYFGTIQPPDVWFYQVSTNRAGNWSFHANKSGQPDNTLTTLSGSAFSWQPDWHSGSTEEQNYTGDQTPGDRTAHVTFRSIAWADETSWYGSTFGSPADTYFAGQPKPATYPDRGVAGFDALTFTDGSNFDTWDARCG